MDPASEDPPIISSLDKHPNKHGLMQLAHAGGHQHVSLLPGEGECMGRAVGCGEGWGPWGPPDRPPHQPVNIQSGCDKKQLLGPQVGRCQVVRTEL